MFARRLIGFLLAAFVVFGALCCCVLAVGLSLVAARQTPIGPTPVDPPAQDVTFPSQSGATIHGWWFPAASAPRGTVVLMHGIGGNRLSMLDRARRLHRDGYNALIFDFQAHAESIGRYITIGYRESFDAAAAVTYAKKRAPDERVAIIGVSMGGAAALLAPLHVDALILESVYPDIDAALRNRLNSNLPRPFNLVMTPVLAPLFEWIVSPVIGVRPDDLRPIGQIAEAHEPVLIMAGDRDTPANETLDLYDAAAKPKCIAFF